MSIGTAADFIGIHVDTLRRWDKSGRLVAVRSRGGQRRYRLSDLSGFKDQVGGGSGSFKQNDGEAGVFQEMEQAPVLASEERVTEQTEQAKWAAPAAGGRRASFRKRVWTGLVLAGLVVGGAVAAFGVGKHLSTKQESTNLQGVLAEATPSAGVEVGGYLGINTDTMINGKLTLNGLTLSGTGVVTVNGVTITLDQDISKASSPTFNALTLTATSNQINLSTGSKITLPDATTTLVGTDTTQTLTNKTLSGSSNTFSNIPNSALSNSKVTVTAGTNLSGGGDVSLGSSLTLNLKDTISLTTATLSGTLGVGGNASLSAGLYFDNVAPVISTTAKQTLTLGDANSGRIQFYNSSNYVDASGNLYLAGSLVSSGGVSGVWQRNSGVVSPTNITDDLVMGATATSGAKFQISGSTGGTTIAPTGSSTTSLTVRGASGSSGNILNVTNSTGATSYLSIDNAGALTVGGSTLTNAGILESGGAIHLTNLSSAVVGTAILGGWTLNSHTFTYRRTITVTNNDGATALPQNYEVTVSLSGSNASQIFSNTRSDQNDFRISYGSTEIARNITTFTSSSIVFTFQLSAAIAASSNSSNYFIYYSNSALALAASTYTGNVQLDNADNVAQWTSSYAGYALSQETTIKQEGTGSVKNVASTGNYPTIATTSQSQLAAGVSKQATVLASIGGTNYLYSVGGQNSGTAQTGVYKSTIDGSGNVTAFSTTSQGQLSTGLTGATAVTAIESVDGGTGADGTLDLSLGGGTGGCNGTGLSWNAGTSTCTIATGTKSTFNFTTVNISNGTTLTTDGPKTTNNFVTIKATGAVTIAGTINVDGKGYSGGAGGACISGNEPGQTGYGPGGGGGAGDTNPATCSPGGGGGGGFGGGGGAGSYYAGYGGSTYDTTSSGSGGGGGGEDSPSGAGGAGGGGIQINSSGNITISGSISANGANGTSVRDGGGGGSGGKILLQGSAVAVSGSLSVAGGNGGGTVYGAGGGGGGRITVKYSSSGSVSSYSVSAGSGATPGPYSGSNGNVGNYTLQSLLNFIYVLGGSTGTAQSTVYKATIDSSGNIGAWSSTGQTALTQALYNHTSNSLTVGTTTYVYVLGGNNGTSDQLTVYRGTVDSSNNLGSWTTTGQGQLPQALSEHASTIVSVGGTNYLYVIGGKNGSTAQTTVYKATIDGSGNIGAFSAVSQGQLSSGLYGHQTFTATVDGTQYLYVLGGKNTAGTTQTTVYRAALDGTGNVGSWSTVAQTALTQALYGLASFANTTSSIQYVYVLGGNNGTSDQTTVYRGQLDPADMSSYIATKTISSTSLTNKNAIQFKTYSSKTGNFMNLEFSNDGGSTWQTSPITVSTANTWETKTWDISAIATSARNTVTKLRFRNTTNTTPYTFYFDDINALTSTFAGTAPTSAGGTASLGAANLDINAQGTGMIRLNYDATNGLAGTGGFTLYNGGTTALFTVDGNGYVGMGTATPTTRLDVRNANATLSVATISGSTNFAALVVDNTVGDLFTASSSGLSRFVIKQNGNIGIGTTVPSQKLDVLGAVRLGANGGANDILNTTAAGGGPSGVLYWGSRSVCDSSGNCSGVGGVVGGTGTTNYLAKWSSTTNIGTGLLYDNGNGVAINTTVPLAFFDVESSGTSSAIASISGKAARAALIVDNSGTGDLFTASSSGLNRFVITQNGNVGIGTTTPGAKLEVAGQVKITGGTPGLNKVLTSDANGLASWSSVTGAGGIGGSGTLNYVAKFTPDGSNIGNSSIFDNGNVGIGTTSPAALLDVRGAASTVSSTLASFNYKGTQILGVTQNDVLVGGKVSMKTDDTNLANAVDTFVYNTYGDFDGGAWTDSDKAQNSSWYNETIAHNGDNCVLGTDTRCGARAFPKRMSVVATSTRVYLFDAKDNSLWMAFSTGTGYAFNNVTSTSITSVYALNGVIYVGTTTNGLLTIDLLSDRIYQYDYNAGAGGRAAFLGNVSQRNSNKGFGARQSWAQIPSNQVNSVMAQVINGKLYVAISTLQGAAVIQVSDQRVVRYTD